MTNQLQTVFAAKATATAVQFNLNFGQKKLEPGYAVDMTAPDGPSTAGGVQAAQSLRLHSPDGAPPLVLGKVDTNANTATLRTHAHLARLHAQRSGAPFSLKPDAYEGFVHDATAFFTERGIAVQLDEGAPPPAAAPAPAASSAKRVDAAVLVHAQREFRNGFFAGLALGAVLGLALAWLFFK